ncbi:MAG: DNA polymerase IV [Acidimicrobiaceae bacterium]|nr:DNA polymerase IV [Acidimicrobiaceae bacterium]MYG56002.1 DNA polymerase IV [Acidimicrobiaceae bacterium]MYJ99995.1 DNA polymerase IV [Acidimicrobiaceae bacterium]
MSSRATILHADLDAFYASVEQRDDPKLRNHAVIVGQGVVLACSYEAKRCGVRSGMGGVLARSLCPQAITVPPRMEAYAEASTQVFEQFHDFTPFVEPLSVDEAFLDVAGAEHLFGPAAQIAEELRTQVRENVGLALSVGVAQTKFLAKVASGQAKPDGIIVVEPGNELSFLHPLPIEVLWGVGRVTAAKLHDHGIDTVGDLASCGREGLKSYLGNHASAHLLALARNHDPRAIDTDRRDRSMGAQRALGQKVRHREDLRLELLALAEKVAARLRRAERVARTVTVRYRTSEMRHESRSRTLPEATQQTDILVAVADELLLDLVDGPHGPGSRLGRVGCTLIGVTYSALGAPDAIQLALPFADSGKPTDVLDTMIDSIRSRWGDKAVARASLLGHKGEVAALTRPTALDSEAAEQSPASEPSTASPDLRQ